MKAESYNHIKEIKKRVINRTWEEKLAEQLKDWAFHSDSYMIEEFYTNLNIPKQTFYDALNRNEKLKEAHIFALERVGINREKLAIKNNLGLNSVTANILPHYFDRWEKHENWKAKLKAEIEAGSSNVPKAVIDYILAGKK